MHQCFGSLNLKQVLLIVAISWTSGWDIHLRYAVPAQLGKTMVVSTGVVVSVALHIAHLTALYIAFASYSGLTCDDPTHLQLYAS